MASSRSVSRRRWRPGASSASGVVPLLVSLRQEHRENAMKPLGAFKDVAGDITPAVLAIRRPGFPQALIGTLRRLANVGHCMVFSPAADGAVRCLLDIGNIAIGGARGLAYSERFQMADANRDAILSQAASAAPIVLPTVARRTYS